MSRPGRKKDKEWAKPLSAGGERLVAHGGDETGVARDAAREPLLQRVQVPLEPLGLTDRRESAQR